VEPRMQTVILKPQHANYGATALQRLWHRRLRRKSNLNKI